MEEPTNLEKLLSEKISEQHTILTELLMTLGPVERVEIDLKAFEEYTLKEHITSIFD